MWTKIITLFLALVPWVIEKLRREEAEKKVLEEQATEAKKDIDHANDIRSAATDDGLLISPAQRKAAKLRVVQTDLRQRYGGSDENPEVSGGSD